MQHLALRTPLLLLVLCLYVPVAQAVTVIQGDKISKSIPQPGQVQIIQGTKVTTPTPTNTLAVNPASSTLQQVAFTPSGSTSIDGLIRKYNKQLEPHQVQYLSKAIQFFSSNYQLDPRLVTSVMAVESSFRWNAVSPTGAVGLGQLLPSTAQWLGVNDPYDPMQNLAGMTRYLRFLLNRYDGSIHHALAAYFQGQGTIDKRGIDASASDYVSKIGRVYARL